MVMSCPIIRVEGDPETGGDETQVPVTRGHKMSFAESLSQGHRPPSLSARAQHCPLRLKQSSEVRGLRWQDQGQRF